MAGKTATEKKKDEGLLQALIGIFSTLGKGAPAELANIKLEAGGLKETLAQRNRDIQKAKRKREGD